MLRLRLSSEFMPLADEYRTVLTHYLQTRDQKKFPLRKKAGHRQAIQDTLRQLNDLDERRQEMRPIPAATPMQANSGGGGRR